MMQNKYLKFLANVFIFHILFLFWNMSYALHPLIIDTDAAFDDGLAILYLFNQPNIDITAITIAGTGEARCKAALDNVGSLLTLTNKKNVPIACGRTKPLAGNHQFPLAFINESDTMRGIANYLPKSKITPQRNAVDLLIKTLQQANQSMDLLMLGPLTNLAEVLTKNPALKNKIHHVYIMGGAVNVAGNIASVEPSIDNHMAEWNIYIDPTAADIVFKSGIAITLIPLNASNDVPIDKDFYEQMAELKARNNIANLIYSFYMTNKNEFLKSEWYFWDQLAAAIMVDESIASFKNMKLRVVLSPENISGSTVIDENNGNTVRVCTHTNPLLFKKNLIISLSKEIGGEEIFS